MNFTNRSASLPPATSEATCTTPEYQPADSTFAELLQKNFTPSSSQLEALASRAEDTALEVPESISYIFKKPHAIAEARYGERLILKCNLATKQWVSVIGYYLEEGKEVIRFATDQRVLANVTFDSTEAVPWAAGCGGGMEIGKKARIGYAQGQQIDDYSFNPGVTVLRMRWDRKLASFVDPDGRVIIGADAVVLGENCQAAVVNPKYVS